MCLIAVVYNISLSLEHRNEYTYSDEILLVWSLNVDASPPFFYCVPRYDLARATSPLIFLDVNIKATSLLCIWITNAKRLFESNDV